MARILIVDDRIAIRRMLRAWLETDHEIVGELSDGRAAASEVAETQADVVVIDYGLPTMNGAEATRTIKARFPHVQVVGYASSGGGFREALKDAGADVVFAKEELTSLLDYLKAFI